MNFWTALGVVFSGVGTFLLTFFNSNFFVGFATVATVFGAVWIYTRQKNAEKQQIAALLVNEVRNAEQAIQALKIRSQATEIPEIIILPQNSWVKYSHLFIKDLDPDQIDSINRFYFDAERANYIVNRGNTLDLFLTNIKYRTEAAHLKVIDIIDKTNEKDLAKEIKKFSDKFYAKDSPFHYSPIGFLTMLDNHLKNITFILDAPAGIKLKELAGEHPEDKIKNRDFISRIFGV